MNRPVGGVPISQSAARPARDALTDIMEPINEIAVDQDQEEVAYIFEKYHLISAPVVDAAGRLVGQITVDDIVNIIQEENREDILRLAGVADEDRGSSVPEIVRGRVPWLAINLATAALGASVIGLVRGHHPAHRRPGRADAHRLGHRRQRGHPGPDRHRPRPGHPRTEQLQRPAHLLARTGGRPGQRPGARAP
jgi:CBS domain-containing protein